MLKCTIIHSEFLFRSSSYSAVHVLYFAHLNYHFVIIFTLFLAKKTFYQL